MSKNTKLMFVVVLVCLLSSMLSACGGGDGSKTLDQQIHPISQETIDKALNDAGKVVDSAAKAVVVPDNRQSNFDKANDIGVDAKNTELDLLNAAVDAAQSLGGEPNSK